MFGNFVNRVLKFTLSRFEGSVPGGGHAEPRDKALFSELEQRIDDYQAHLEALSFRKATIELRAIWAAGNVYLGDLEPWRLLDADRLARRASCARP